MMSYSLRVTLLILVLLLISTNSFSRRFSNDKYTTKYDVYFRKYSKRYFAGSIDWQWFKAQAITESNLNNEAKSWVNAKGVMQVMPATFRSLKSKVTDLGDITDPKWNIAAGIYYDRKMWNYWKAERPFDDKLSFMFASYNAGAGTILRAQKVCVKHNLNENLWNSVRQVSPKVRKWHDKETLRYIDKIFLFKGEMK